MESLRREILDVTRKSEEITLSNDTETAVHQIKSFVARICNIDLQEIDLNTTRKPKAMLAKQLIVRLIEEFITQDIQELSNYTNLTIKSIDRIINDLFWLDDNGEMLAIIKSKIKNKDVPIQSTSRKKKPN